MQYLLKKHGLVRINQLVLLFVFCGLASLMASLSWGDDTVDVLQDSGSSSGSVASNPKELLKPSQVANRDDFKRMGINNMGGKLYLSRSLEVEKAIQSDRYFEVIGVATPTTPAAGHARVYLSSSTKQICAKYDDASTSCLSPSGALITNNVIQANSAGTYYGAAVSLSSSVVGTLPDTNLSSNVDLLGSTQTISAQKTFKQTLTMSGATIAMGSNKITGLADGTASTDAVAFGQISGFRIVQITSGTTSTTASSTSSSYADTNLTAGIVPHSNTAKILVVVNQEVGATGGNGVTVCSLQLLRASSVIWGPFPAAYQGAVVANDMEVTYPLMYLDSPASTSAQTYKTQFARTAGTGTVFAQNAPATVTTQSTMYLIEIN